MNYSDIVWANRQKTQEMRNILRVFAYRKRLEKWSEKECNRRLTLLVGLNAQNPKPPMKASA